MEWVGVVGASQGDPAGRGESAVLGGVPLRDSLGGAVRMLLGGPGVGGWWGAGGAGVSCWSGDRDCGRVQDKDCAAIRPHCAGVHTEDRRILSGRRCKRICSCRRSVGIGLLDWLESGKESRGAGSSVLSCACGGGDRLSQRSRTSSTVRSFDTDTSEVNMQKRRDRSSQE